MSNVELYSMSFCPFAQRARLMLRRKGVDFATHEIDVTKPRSASFLQINPEGKVPVIRHEGRVLNESSVICEYLEDAFPEPPTLPREPYTRALARIMVDHCNNQFVPLMYRLLMNQDRSADAKLIDQALATWRWVDELLSRHNPNGTFLDDRDGFSLAEINYAPFFQRYCLNEHYRGFRLPDEAGFARVRRFRDALLGDALVKETGMSDEDFIKLYFDYSLGFGNGSVPPGRERSSFDLSVPLAERPLPPAAPRAV
ncbi:glutathione S-transferase family protein [Vulgatibacter incomptus]|uniref:Glutathione S-transferase family protein n=1 Tax=Vulgatibacter incomptus TaxID=1391653 RepID=A0A0K1PDM3_9BACT|nr:glutathione S-transferase family protein [Vulgatibacter incomptus]AKU91511.1 Glutathione S-transferase family protein [Vulgatibacter incomptus]